MRAVILAAGAGRRLRAAIGARPKCLAEVGGATLLEHQLRHLQAAGLERVTLVLGYEGGAIERVAGPGLDVIYNTAFATTNSLYSLWLARERLRDGFVVLNADVLFHPAVLANLLAAPAPDALLVAGREPGVVYSDEEMKVTVRHGAVTAISKQLADADADGESVGIAKFGARGAALLIEQLEAIVATGAHQHWLPRAFDAFCRLRPLHVVDTRPYPWIEIDFPDDYARACQEIWPAIQLTVDAPVASPPPAPVSVPATAPGRMFRRV